MQTYTYIYIYTHTRNIPSGLKFKNLKKAEFSKFDRKEAVWCLFISRKTKPEKLSSVQMQIANTAN